MKILKVATNISKCELRIDFGLRKHLGVELELVPPTGIICPLAHSESSLGKAAVRAETCAIPDVVNELNPGVGVESAFK